MHLAGRTRNKGLRYSILTGIGGALVLVLLFAAVYPPPQIQHSVESSLTLDSDRVSVATHQGSHRQWRNLSGSRLIWRADEGQAKAQLIVDLNRPWDLSNQWVLEIPVQNLGWGGITLIADVKSPRSESEATPMGTADFTGWVRSRIWLNRFEEKILKVRLQRPLEGVPTIDPLYGMRGTPWEVRLYSDKPLPRLDPERVSEIILTIDQNTRSHRIAVGDPGATGKFVPPAVSPVWEDSESFFPFIDRFGQYRHKDWPGKIDSEEDLRRNARIETEELLDNRGPKNWDRFGGWADGPKLEATGHFRTQKWNGAWWLVTPQGTLYFAQGVDIVETKYATTIEERADWFEWIPEVDDDAFAASRTEGWAYTGHYAGRGRDLSCLSFFRANLIRKYGEWKPSAYYERVHQRLRSWGLNATGGDPNFVGLLRTPYTLRAWSMGARPIKTGNGAHHNVPDVFDPSFRLKIENRLKSFHKQGLINPLLIGIFIDNELPWGSPTSLAEAALKSPADQPAKIAFRSFLREKHGDIGTLNQSWQQDFESWDHFLSTEFAHIPDPAESDLLAFNEVFVDLYFRTCKELISTHAPGKLYLGCRFRHFPGDLGPIKECARYADVVSVNAYGGHPRSWFQLPSGIDAPILISEYHFGAPDRGPFHPSFFPAPNQEERASRYRNYVEACIEDPQIVGCMWFQYADQPTTGRVFDGDNKQVGFVDTCDTPYPLMIAATRKLAKLLYARRGENLQRLLSIHRGGR